MGATTLIEPARIFHLGDGALTVEFGTEIDENLNRSAIALADHFEQNPFDGFIEAVPAYASTTIFYDLETVLTRAPQRTAFDFVVELVETALTSIAAADDSVSRIVEIPVRFGGDAGPDLAAVAEIHSLDPAKVVEIFTGTVYRVYMLGFLPGFSYMGEVDERIATPRKQTPRVKVPKGSVGIAGKQTGIYSLDSPGGWQLIGVTAVPLFDANSEEPCYLRPGDRVRFTASEQ